jgi:NAD(P)-dependent dehydrogenase (short-subunit alcohol dehydrogenase family)
LISEIRSTYPNAKVNIIPIKLDLSSLETTKAAAAAITAQATRLDILYNNAGIAMTEPSLTKDGYETQFGVNYVGHAMFTQALLPLMLQTAARAPPNSVRIINLASQAHIWAPSNGLALAEAKTDMASYYKMYPSVISVSLHPGFVATEMNLGKAGGGPLASWLRGKVVGFLGMNAQEGAKTQLWCGIAEEVENGKYYEPIGVKKAGSKWVQDESKRDELWLWTEKEMKAHGGPGWPEAK